MMDIIFSPFFVVWVLFKQLFGSLINYWWISIVVGFWIYKVNKHE